MIPQINYEQQLAKARKTQERRLTKQKSKLSDPQFIKEQQEPQGSSLCYYI